MRPAVEISFLDEDCQRDLVDEIDLNDCTPSHDQTIRMRKMFDEGKLTPEAIQAIMSEQKPNQRERIVLSGDKVRQYNAVLPAEPKLEAEILMSGAKTVCERCGVPIEKHSNRQKYCADCARIMYLKNKAKYQRNKRSGVDN